MAELPASPDLYKNAINLNRYSNRVAKKIAIRYNQIIKDAIDEIRDIDTMPRRQAQLRRTVGSLKKSLDTWVTETSKELKTEITGLAESQSEFAIIELLDQIRSDPKTLNLKELVVSPDFAESIVSTDPTELNQVMLSDDLEQRVSGDRRATYSLGKRDGAMLTLPDGQPLEKSFRGLATKSAEKFRYAVQDGMLTGASVDRIAKGLIGSQFSREGSVRQIAATGGKDLTALANHQILTLVRTSVNQVANVASQKTYMAAGEDITDNFRFVATLDSRTSLTCATKDGKIYSYDKGPVPPLHFNCRSTTVAVPNWEALREKYGIEPPDDEVVRASVDGPVSAKTQYGEWLYEQRAVDSKGKYSGPGLEQIDALGIQKANYFNQLVERRTGQLTKNGKYKPETAMRIAANDSIVSLVRTDGSEKTLEEIRRAYKLKEKKVRELIEHLLVKEEASRSVKKVAKGESPSIAQLQIMLGGAKVGAADVNKVFDLMDEMEGVAGENARKLRMFTEKKQVACIWSTQREGTIVKNRSKMDHVLKSAQVKKSMERALKNEKAFIGNTKDVYRTILDNAINVDEKQSGPSSKLSFASGEVKRYLTAQGKGRSKMNGMTFPGANHILIKRKADMRPITSLTQMREDVKEAVKTAKKGKSLYWSANGEGMLKGKSHWLKTYVHEMGHQVHYTSGKPTLSSYDWTPSEYGSSNSAERFAETFVQYIFAPVELKKASPSAYKWVEDTLSSSLKEVEKWK